MSTHSHPPTRPPAHPPAHPLPLLQVMLTSGLTAADRAALLNGAHDKAGDHLSRLLKFVVARAGGSWAPGECIGMGRGVLSALSLLIAVPTLQFIKQQQLPCNNKNKHFKHSKQTSHHLLHNITQL